MRTRNWEQRLKVSAPIRIGIALSCAGIWAAVLFPVFATSRHGHRISCLSNVKQMDLCLLMYAQDYDERLPRASEWMDATLGYSKNIGIYHCPDLPSHNPDEFGYAFNNLFTTKATHDIRDPEKAILLYDSNSLRWNANSTGSSDMANPPRCLGVDIIGFVDGHARPIKLTADEGMTN